MGKFRKHGSKHDKGPKKPKNNKGPRKDKIHGLKKGSKGVAAQYVTRAQALKKLQVSLVDFRRLCILKGIYPRDPKKKPAGNDKTYYHIKDVRFLQHEPLLNKFFELKTFFKKYKRCVGRQDKDSTKRLEERKPTYTLHHLVRERYPTFADAIRDLDDALSMVALYDALPTDRKREIRSDVIQESTQLIHEFYLFIIQSRSLQKCFASIKGYYFQADIQGETVTWLVPHKYAQELPLEVDFKVMSTFNEFYRTMLKFINFKLYAENQWSYPPKFNYRRHAADMAKFFVTSVNSAASGAEAAKEEEKQKVDAATIQDFAAVSEEVQQMEKDKQKSGGKQVFAGLKVFIQREVPFHSIYFVLKCGGAQVGWAAMPGSPFKETDAGVTHQIIDRPSSQFKQAAGREYVQPQWVLDCFNEGRRLPIEPYLPDRVCPPHLSPFVNDTEEGYVPKQREILDKLAAAEDGGSKQTSNDSNNVITNNMEEEGDAQEARFMAELEAETRGVWASDYQERLKQGILMEGDESGDDINEDSDDEGAEEDDEEEDDVLLSAAPEQGKMKKSKAELEKEEDLERRKAMMPKKHQRLYQRIEKGEKQKVDAANKLAQKRNTIETKKDGKKKKIKAGKK